MIGEIQGKALWEIFVILQYCFQVGPEAKFWQISEKILALYVTDM